MFLKISQSSQENTGFRASFSDKATNLKLFYLKKNAPTQVFCCEFCKVGNISGQVPFLVK